MPGGVIDEAVVNQFFNELEIDNDDTSDLDLLVEAEKRGLLDERCAVLLHEARVRGWVPPKAEEEIQSRFIVRHIGCTNMKIVGQNPTGHEIAAALKTIMESPREGATDHCMMVVGTESVKVSIDTSMPNFTLTLQRRRKEKKKKSPEETEKELLVHRIREMHTCCTFDKILCVITMTPDDSSSGKSGLWCFAYKCRSSRQAANGVGAINDSCTRILEQTRREQQQDKQLADLHFPEFTVQLARGPEGYGFFFVGPRTIVEEQGIFISKMIDGSPAATHPDLKVGLQVMAINTISCEKATMMEMRNMLKAAGNLLVLKVKENPMGFAKYAQKLGLNRGKLQSNFVAHSVSRTETAEDDPVVSPAVDVEDVKPAVVVAISEPGYDVPVHGSTGANRPDDPGYAPIGGTLATTKM